MEIAGDCSLNDVGVMKQKDVLRPDSLLEDSDPD